MPMPIHHLPGRCRAALAVVVTALAGCGGSLHAGEQTGPAAADADDTTAHNQALAARAPNPWMSTSLLILQIDKTTTIGAVLAVAGGGTVIDRLDARPIYLVSVANPNAATPVLRNARGVLFVERNRPVTSPEQAGAIKNSVSAIGSGHDGPPLADRWGENMLRLDELNSKQGKGLGVIVGVLDTGVDPLHPELKRRLVARGYDFVSRDMSPWDDVPFTDRPFTLADAPHWAYGHGTHVAGVIARLAPEARIMPVRVLDTHGIGTLWTVAKGVVWAIDPDKKPDTDDGAAVLNLSLGTSGPASVLQRVIEIAGCSPKLVQSASTFDHPGFDADRRRCTAGHQEAVVFAGAGNNPAAGTELYPAAYALKTAANPAGYALKGLGSVTASTALRTIAPFANRDAGVYLAAPGDKITSTFPNNSYATMSGTSMATPWASGTAAWVLSTVPPGGGNPALPLPRRWGNAAALARVSNIALTTPLCVASPIRHVNPLAAVTVVPPPAAPCV